MSDVDDPWRDRWLDPPPDDQPPQHPGALLALRGNRGLGVAVVGLSTVLVAGDVLSAISAPFALRSYHRAVAQGIDPTAVVTAHDFVQPIVLVAIPLWVVTSLWLARAWGNAAALDTQALQRSVAWCWLGWVVPVVSLWFPKQIVDDCWAVTVGRHGSPDRDARQRATRIWWVLWIGYGLATYLLAGVAYSGPVADRGVNVVTEIITAVLGVSALVAWARVVRGVSAAQEALALRPPS